MVKYILAATILLGMQAAQAKYECQDYHQNALVITEHFPTRIGNVSATLTANGTQQNFEGNLMNEGANDDLYQKQVVDIFPYNGKKSITITKAPKNCGRALCDDSAGVNIHAQLKLDGVESYFSCNETH